MWKAIGCKIWCRNRLAMSDLLQTIQNQVAQEYNGMLWEQLHIYETKNRLWPEVCKRYAFEVATKFAYWAANNRYKLYEVEGGDFCKWYKYQKKDIPDIHRSYYTTEELFEKYVKSENIKL